jgi:cytochrome c-type biogenesis protein CcsB
MATSSYFLYVVAGILLAGAFAAHVAHTALLASGRRLAAAPAPRSVPAFAGAVGGSFVEEIGLGAGDGTPRSAAGPFAIGLAWAAFGLLADTLLLRGIVVGRGPWGNLYEFSVALTTAIVGCYLFLQRRYPVRELGFLPLGLALALFLYSRTLPMDAAEGDRDAGAGAPEPTAPDDPRVGFAMLSYGIFAMSFAAGVGCLVREKRLADGQTVDRFAWLPSRDVLDAVAYRAVIIGFPVFATMIVLGTWWASIAWSRYWGWDPKESSALVTWLAYGVYLHLRNQKGWRGRPAAMVLVTGFGMVLFTLFGNLWFSGLRSYSGLT